MANIQPDSGASMRPRVCPRAEIAVQQHATMGCVQRTQSSLSETTVTRTLSRGLDVLEALARANEDGLGPSAIGQRVSLDKATVTRLLRTLVEAGYVTQDEATRRYRLTGRILWLAHRATVRLDLRSVARPHLAALRDELGETVHLGVMEGLGVVYVDKLEAANSIQLVSAIGQTMPLHSTSLGKAMLAALPDEEREATYARMDLSRRTDRTILDLTAFREEIRRTQLCGYSTDDRENEPFGACVGAAIVGADGRPVGAISISGPSFRIHDRLAVLRRTRARRGRSDRPGAGGRRRPVARRSPSRQPRGILMLPRDVDAKLAGVFAPICTPFRRERGRRPRRPAVQPRALRGDAGSSATWRSGPTARTAAWRKTRSCASSTMSCGTRAPGRWSWPVPRTTASARRSGFLAAAADLGADFGLVLSPGYFRAQMTDEVLYRYFSIARRRRADPDPPLQRPGLLRRHAEPGAGRAPGGPSEHRRHQGQRGERHRGLPAVPGPVVPGPGGIGQLPLPGHDGRLAGRHGVARQLLPPARAGPVRIRARHTTRPTASPSRHASAASTRRSPEPTGWRASRRP